MLGLGDIVIPGIFISLCLKFDIDKCLKTNKCKSLSDFKIPYHTVSFIGYILGIAITFAVMFIFEHPQPALLFLVPTCTLSMLLRSVFCGELNEVINYNSKPEEEEKTDEEKEKLKEGNEKKED